MIKAIFFDAAGILYTRSGPTEDFALSMLQERGFSVEPSSDQMTHQAELRTRANQGNITHLDFWDYFLQIRGIQDSQQRSDFSSEIISFSNNIQPTPGARQTLAELKEKGFLLGIITDTMYPREWKMARLKNAGVDEFIDIVACSTELGVHKPDPAIYSYALKQAGLEKGESIFVGHLGIELDGAHTAGMITVAVYYDPDARADYYCQSITELLTLPILQKVTQ